MKSLTLAKLSFLEKNSATLIIPKLSKNTIGVLGIGSAQSNWLTKLAQTLRTIMGYFPKKNPRSYLSLNLVIFNNFDLLKIG